MMFYYKYSITTGTTMTIYTEKKEKKCGEHWCMSVDDGDVLFLDPHVT